MVRLSIALLAGCCAGLIPAVAGASEAAPRFCVVPVEDGAPIEADLWQTWRLSNHSFRIPGIPALVFTPSNRKGDWTIDTERRLVRYFGPFPRSPLDRNNWVQEPWSSRIVASTFGGGVSVLRPGTDQFELVTPERSIGYSRPQMLPRRKLTIVIHEGVPFIVDDRSLQPWLSKEDLSKRGIRGIAAMHDAPSLAATVVIDNDSQIHVLTDDDQWHKLGSIKMRDYGSVFAVPNANAVLFLGQKSVVSIRKSNATPPVYSAERLLTTKANDASRRLFTSGLFQQVLTYDSAGMFGRPERWRRLGPNGFEDISGGFTGTPSNVEKFGRIRELPVAGHTVIVGEFQLYRYDGREIKPVPNSMEEHIGKHHLFYDLPSIGKALFTSQKGIFELTGDGGIVERPMPFTTDGLPQTALADWPEAGVVLALSRDGLFALDRDLKAHRVVGGDMIKSRSSRFANGTNPGTGEMVITSDAGLFLAVDSKRSTGVCPALSP